MMVIMKVLNNWEWVIYLVDWIGKLSIFEFFVVLKVNEL